MAEVPTTQRAYTLRLSGTKQDNHSWRLWLWNTHEAVNRGAKVFGDWLLTMRGGIDHSLADAKNAEECANRRIVLALSWLSVESQNGAPPKRFHVPRDKTTEALVEILRLRRVGKSEIESWLADCQASLTAAIRDDAVWVNRSAMFDEAVSEIGKSLTRDEVWDLLERFFGSQDAYFEGLTTGDANEDEESPAQEEEKAKDLAQKARGWLSNRFGSGAGTDFGAVSDEYAAFAKWCRWRSDNLKESTEAAGKQLLKSLKVSEMPPRLASTPGPPNRVQMTYQQVVASIRGSKKLPTVDYAELAEIAETQAEAKRKLVGRKDTKPWAAKMLKEVVDACGIPYRDDEADADLINEYSVILDHAARRICMAHSWIKRAESNRRTFAKDARKLDELTATSPDAVRLVDELRAQRTKDTNALEEVPIRKGAVSDWEQIVKAWSRKKCKTAPDRIQAAREVQADPENGKPGDIQLYEMLAADKYACVWQQDGKPAYSILKDYVAATDAIAKQRRFKVPAYRHPDPLLHPVFCDFGESRWSIDFSAHRAPAGREVAHATLQRKTDELQKARDAMFKAKNAEQRQKAQAKVEKLEQSVDAALAAATFLDWRHALKLRLFDGSSVAERDLQWHSKRLGADLALRQESASTKAPILVSRADRFGRAAAGVNGDAPIAIRDLFELKEWNGRLQAPRSQLDAIAAIRDKKKKPDLSAAERKTLVEQMLSRLSWLVTFSAKLQPQGPWVSFSDKLPEGFKFDWKKQRLYHDANKGRKSRSLIVLSRIPSLRLISVDLGHRFAAACAVWETLSAKQVKQLCDAAGASPPAADEFFKVIKHGKKRIVLRRIAGDKLDGSLHPSPWARLERQFLIKLQGEEAPARKASQEEIDAVEQLAKEVGYKRPRVRTGSELQVDWLMAEAVRLVRLALARHRRRAKIAFQLTAKQIPGMGQRMTKLDKQGRFDLLVKTLSDWSDLASGGDWSDEFAAQAWNKHAQPLCGNLELPQRIDTDAPQTRRKQREETAEKLTPVAAILAERDLTKLHIEWADAWRKENAKWAKRLRWLRDWLVPRKSKARESGIRHVGGLSVRRIATLKELYQVQKAFRTQPEPDSPTKNIPDRDDDRLRRFGQRVLTAMERLRENRVKQVASRIIEAALGIGREPSWNGKKQAKRSRTQTHAPCHAVVIENLKNYRPDELQTRRENRQLMAWASANVRKYLSEGCQLHGLYMREVPAAYTSRQDSRTGQPGIRCKDVDVNEFLAPHWSVARAANALLDGENVEIADPKERIEAAAKLVDAGKGNAEQRYLIDLYRHWQSQPEAKRMGRSIRIVQRGGEIFAPCHRSSPVKGGIQADLNAAANIGLKALLDPDWPGAWWYVPVDGTTFVPLAKSVDGTQAMDPKSPLRDVPEPDGAESPPKKGRKSKAPSDRENVVNLWRFISDKPLADDKWFDYQQYANYVQKRVIEILRAQAGLPQDGS